MDVDLEKRFSVSKGEDYFLYGGWEVDTDSTGNFYFLDREDRRVKKFDSQGNFLHSIGAGRGPGPAEFDWPMDFAVTSVGEVWIIDQLGQRKLSRFSPAGSLATSFQLDGTSMPTSIAMTENGNAIVLAHGSGPVFRKWTASGKLLSEFGTLLREQKRTFLALDGMVRGGPDGFVFVPNRTGHLLRFSADGTLEYAVQTMDDVPFPTVEYSSEHRSTSLDPVRRFSTLDVEVVNGKIYCYSFPSSSPGKRVLDVYRYDDGRYLHSLKLPVDFKKFGLTEDFLIEVHPGEMTVWRWERDAVSTEN